MTADDMALEILLWRFVELPDDVLLDIIETNAREQEFAPDARGLKRIWKEMKRAHREAMFDDYDKDDAGFGPARRAKLRSVVDDAVKLDRELYSNSYDEIAELYARVQHEQSEVLDQERSEFDSDAFFNDPEATADFKVWLQMPMWSIDEATALSLGKNPELVNTKSLKRIKKNKSNFAKIYAFRHAAIERAVGGGQLSEPMRRADFIKWAEEHHIELPDPLGKSASRAADLPSAMTPTTERSARQKAASEETARQREESTMLRIIEIMAKAKYKCENPTMIPQAVNAIVGHGIELDIKVSDDSVRKYLRLAIDESAK